MGPTPEPERFSAILEVSGGKFATFQTVSELSIKGKIVVKHSQKQSSDLTVYKVPDVQDISVSLAFCFELNEKKYVLGVERRKICFKIQAEIQDFTNEFLFRWANNKGQYGSLCSVAEPSQYLFVHSKEVILSCKPYHGFKVNFLKQNTLQSIKVHCAERDHKRRAGTPGQDAVQEIVQDLCSVGPPNMNKKRPRKRKAWFSYS